MMDDQSAIEPRQQTLSVIMEALPLKYQGHLQTDPISHNVRTCH